MTDLFAIEVWVSILAGLTAIIGFAVFSFICLFSEWARPFLRESKTNFGRWLKGDYSILHGSPEEIAEPTVVPMKPYHGE